MNWRPNSAYVCTSHCTHQRSCTLHTFIRMYVCIMVRIPNNNSSNSSLNCVVYFIVNKETVRFLRGNPRTVSIVRTHITFCTSPTYIRTYVHRYPTIWMSSRSPWISPQWRRRSTHTSTSLLMTSRETSPWCGVTP